MSLRSCTRIAFSGGEKKRLSFHPCKTEWLLIQKLVGSDSFHFSPALVYSPLYRKVHNFGDWGGGGSGLVGLNAK